MQQRQWVGDVESVWVEIMNSRGTMIFDSSCRSPKCDHLIGRNINGEISKACLKGIAIVMGSFNRHADWTNQSHKVIIQEISMVCIRDYILEWNATKSIQEQAVLD